jgi:hypothetical protein
MPCVTCAKIFKIKPCNHPTGRFKDKSEIYNEANLIIYNIIEHYYNLHAYCPCKICLVSPACQMGLDCKPFMSRISPNAYFTDKKHKLTFTDNGWAIVHDIESFE